MSKTQKQGAIYTLCAVANWYFLSIKTFYSDIM